MRKQGMRIDIYCDTSPEFNDVVLMLNSLILAGVPAPGTKPPPLTMVNSINRTTATVPPLNQVSPSRGITSVGGANASALSATPGSSSFAAALRKLAKQAGQYI